MKLPPYITPSSRNHARRRTRRRWLRVAGVVVTTIAAAAVVVWAIFLPGIDKTANPLTATSSTESPSSAMSSTSTIVITTSTTAKETSNLIFNATLTGAGESPPVQTPATGTFTVTVPEDGSRPHYVLTVNGITDVTVARLRTGRPGDIGALLLTIYGGGIKSGLFSGQLTQGSFTEAKFEGPLQGKTMADFVALVQAGRVFLNVSTSAHPRGEIRGYLE